MELIHNKAHLIKEYVVREKQRNDELRKKNTLLEQNLKRIQKTSQHSKNLIKQVEWLQSQLNQTKTGIFNFKQSAAKILHKKDLLLEKYETIIHDNDLFTKKSTQTMATVTDLKMEVEDREIENRNLIHELAFLQKENEEMESRILILEEKEVSDSKDFIPHSETRVVATAEFSNGLGSFLVTYSDLITLILVIFVLLYSISKVDGGKFTEVFSTFQGQDIQLLHRNVRLSTKEFEMLKHVRELVKDNVDPESLVRSDVRTILFRLKSSDLFDPGSANLIEGAEDLILNSIQNEMREGVKQIHVDGHTDNVPMASDGKFPTNWELSSVRASHVARVIIEKSQFPPDRMVVTGYGEYRPIQPNISDNNRALNRRVEIKILKDIKIVTEKKGIKSPKLN